MTSPQRSSGAVGWHHQLVVFPCICQGAYASSFLLFISILTFDGFARWCIHDAAAPESVASGPLALTMTRTSAPVRRRAPASARHHQLLLLVLDEVSQHANISRAAFLAARWPPHSPGGTGRRCRSSSLIFLPLSASPASSLRQSARVTGGGVVRKRDAWPLYARRRWRSRSPAYSRNIAVADGSFSVWIPWHSANSEAGVGHDGVPRYCRQTTRASCS